MTRRHHTRLTKATSPVDFDAKPHFSRWSRQQRDCRLQVSLAGLPRLVVQQCGVPTLVATRDGAASMARRFELAPSVTSSGMKSFDGARWAAAKGVGGQSTAVAFVSHWPRSTL